MSTANHGLHPAAEKLSQLQQIASIYTDSGETGQLLSDLRNLLVSFPQRPGDCDWSYTLIRCMAERGGANASHRTALALSSSGIPLSILIQSSGNGSVDFALGTCSSGEKTLHHILNSTLRILQSEAFCPHREGFALNRTAVCTVLPEKTGAEYSAAWLDDLIHLVCSGRCRVTMDFYPIDADDSWLKQHTEALALIHDRLTALSDTTIQITENIAKKRLAQTSPDGSEFSAAVTRHNTLARQGAALAAAELSRLQQVLRSGGWMIQLRLMSDDPYLMESVQAILSSHLMTHGLDCRWDSPETPGISLLLPKQDLPGLLSFPEKPFPGLHMAPVPDFGATMPDPIWKEGAEIGNLIWQNTVTGSRFRIPHNAFVRHMGLFGTAGAGKTNAIRTMLTAMPDVPALILDPNCCGYRGMTHGEVCPMDAGSTKRLQINPFWFPEGGSLPYHIHALTKLLCAALRMDDTMTGILEQCITKTYADMGWNPVTSRNYYADLLEDEKLYPTFTQLCETVETFFDKVAYDSSMMTYKHAITVRLRSFTGGACGVLLNCPVVTPLENWFRSGKSIVVEFGGLAGDHAKSIAAGALLLQFLQYIRTAAMPAQTLNRLLVLDDAQWLFGQDSGSEGLLRDILTQLPAFGLGCITASLTPQQLHPEVLSRIEGKIVFCSVEREAVTYLHHDLLPDAPEGVLQHLKLGSALIRFRGMDKPAQVLFDLSQETLSRLTMVQKPEDQPAEVAELLLDTSSELRSLVYSLMEPLYYQVLFDNDRANLSKALSDSLYSVVRDALIHHNLSHMLTGLDTEAVIVHLIKTVFAAFIRTRTPLGYCLQNMVEMFTSRILHLTAGGGTLRAADWRALMDYRSFMLDNRFLEMFRRSNTTTITLLRERFGVTAHLELVASILEKAYNAKWRSLSDEELYESLLPGLSELFLRLPDEKRVREELFTPVFTCLRSRQS